MRMVAKTAAYPSEVLVRPRIPTISRVELSCFIAILFWLVNLLAYQREIPHKVSLKEKITMMITSRITISLVAACFFGTASFASAKEKAPAKEKAGAGTSEYTKGIQLLDGQQYDQAVTEFTKAILANDKQPVFYEGRGFAYLALQRFQEAGDDFSKAIELLPKDERAYLGRAQVLLQQKAYQPALADTEKALELKPDDVNATKLRGFAELGLSQWDKAAADFTAVIQKNPDDLLSYDRRALAYRG